VEEIVSAVDTTIGEDRAIARKVAMYLCHRHSGATLREIGDRFAVGESAVSQGSRRLRQEIQKDDSLKGQIERICLELGIVNV